MPIFEKGDKVKIPTRKTKGVSFEKFNEDVPTHPKEGYYVVGSFSSQGSTCEIVRPDGTSPAWTSFSHEDLEPFIESPIFEVGDEVEIVKNTTGGYDEGTKAIVIAVGTDDYRGDYVTVEKDQYTSYHHYVNDLKLIKKANMKKIIGYKCPIQLHELVPKGTLFTKNHEDSRYYGPVDSKGKSIYETYKAHQLPVWIPVKDMESSGWEPVYEEQEKQLTFGDITITIGKDKLHADGKDWRFNDIKDIYRALKGNNDNSGINGYKVIYPTVKIGCLELTEANLLQILNTYNELNTTA